MGKWSLLYELQGGYGGKRLEAIPCGTGRVAGSWAVAISCVAK